jgi:uncharacterized protein with PIN domain
MAEEAPKRLLADRMLGRLAKFLRMLGQDVEYNREGSSAEAAARAASEGRILLTRSARKRVGPESQPIFIVESNYPFHQAREVLLGLSLTVRDDFARCIEDNGLLEVVGREQARDHVPERVLAEYERFHRCPRCERLYWDGRHLQGMRTTISALEAAPLAHDEEEFPDAPPTPMLDPLLDLHQALEVAFLQHRVALMKGELPRAGFELRRFSAWMRRHIGDENELVLPLYQRRPPPEGYERGAAPEIFSNEHEKILDHLDRLELAFQALERLAEAPDRLPASCLNLLDREKILVDLLEHHDRRERLHLYPTLERNLRIEEKQELLAMLLPAMGLESRSLKVG